MMDGIGACRYCGQIVAVEDVETKEEADEYATLHCNCTQGRLERQKKEQIAAAKEQVEQLFGKESVQRGFRNALPEQAVEFLKCIVETVAREQIESAKIGFGTYGSASVDVTAKGMVRVQRSQGHSVKAEV